MPKFILDIDESQHNVFQIIVEAPGLSEARCKISDLELSDVLEPMDKVERFNRRRIVSAYRLAEPSDITDPKDGGPDGFRNV